MYQITLFKKVIYKIINYLINIHQNISNCTNFAVFLGEPAPEPP